MHKRNDNIALDTDNLPHFVTLQITYTSITFAMMRYSIDYMHYNIAFIADVGVHVLYNFDREDDVADEMNALHFVLRTNICKDNVEDGEGNSDKVHSSVIVI